MAATATYKAKLTYPQVFLWRMGLFVILAILLAIILDGQTQQLRTSFMANPGLNGLILGVLFIGIVYAFRQVLRLYPEIRWVNSFRISDPGITVDTTPTLLAPMATMLRDRTGHLSLATGAMRSLLDSVASRLDEQRETTRYLVGLLVFLGLLGTFWGLLQTVTSVGTTISALDTNGAESVMLFDQLKEGLAAPLKGMGTAFSCSMFGLAGIARIVAPDFTITLRASAPSLRVTDEQSIPEWFWIPQPARLDKRSLTETLKAGEVIAGAELANPQNTISVRTR